MKILIYGAVPTQPNLGVSALAHGAEAVLRRAFPNADIRFRSTGSEGDGPMSVTHVSPFLKAALSNQLGVRTWMRSFSMVCDIRGGDSFTDIYTTRMLLKLSAFPFVSRALGVPLVMLPQTIGPFEKRSSRLLARAYLKACSLVMARDPRSAEFSADLGRPVDLCSTDVVFAVPQPPPGPKDLDVIVNVSGLLWPENRHVDAGAYQRSVRLIIDGLLARGRRVTLLSHVTGQTAAPGDNDRQPVAELQAEYGTRVDSVLAFDLEQARSTIARGRVLIGARMHACLNALSVGVPAVPMAYSRKFAPLLESLEWHHTVSLVGTAEDMASRTLAAVGAAEADDVTGVMARAHARIDETVEALRSIPRSRR